MRNLMTALFLALPTIAWAQSMETMEIATNLGSVLASEQKCGLSYSQPAIEAYIEKNVPADDMDFPSTLSMMTQGSEFQMRDMSQSALTAHCSQIKRVAKSYGFTE